MGNSEVWRMLRKAVHTILATQASLEYLPIQKAEAAQLMYDILLSVRAANILKRKDLLQ
ncbi:hypothetical protein ARMGADRAFT_1070238 [Armillaria gallica]|uniref:Uncharacterized protein n=1 Tax=Armillaria gallica TaxID=47427 RepID=A0A2H3EZ89_ARMGA|nr:hypothetical protein ARMGADRAFT_1070238 [Armillaria gallica]